MTAKEVLEVYFWLEQNGITVWIDGGWCVDALLGEESREHSDLDIAVERTDNNKLRKLLEDRGFVEVVRKDSTEWVYVMKDTQGKKVDVHVFEYDKAGNNVYGIDYPYGSLTGKGTIAGQKVNCISAEWMFKFKTAYPPKEKDLRDVRALSKRFGFALPKGY